MKKKITMLFAALLACVGVWAQTWVLSSNPSATLNALSEISADKYYVLQTADEYGMNLYLTDNGEKMIVNQSLTAMDESSRNYLWQIINEGETYSIKNLGTGKYFPTLEKNQVPSTVDEATAGDFVFIDQTETGAGLWNIKNSSDAVCLNVSGWWGYTSANTTGWDAQGGNSNYKIFVADVVDLDAIVEVAVTYNYTFEGEVKHTETVTQLTGEAYAAPALDYVQIAYPDDNTVSEENKVINLTCTETLPFEKTTDLNNPKWYAVSLHSNQNFFLWYYNGNDALVETPVPALKASDYSVVNDDAYFWCFVGNAFDGFKIYNKKAGTEYTLNITASNPQVGTATDGNDVWKLVKSTSSIANSACFEGNAGSYINHNGGVKYHNATDEGSSALFYTPASFPLNNINLEKSVPAGAVGFRAYFEDAENVEKIATAVSVAENAPFDFTKAQELAVLCEEVAASEAIALTAGYYFVKNTGDAGNNASWYLTHKINNEKECVWAQAPSGNLNADYVWKFETCEDGYKIQSANVGKYFQMKTATNGGDNNTYIENDYDQGNKFLFTSNLGKFSIKNANGANIRTEGSGQVNYWNGEANETWYLIPVTELEVTINEFASICLPFNVEVEGATAYAVTATATETVTLTEKTDIPAGEGAILEGNGTAKLVLATAASDWSDNLLEGTTVKTEVEGKSYILANGSAGIGLYSVKLTDDKFTNNANKAYLPAPAGTEAAMFSFGRGEGTTGIETAVSGEQTVVIYDLAGRRVEKMEKGIYIVNGKKVVR